MTDTDTSDTDFGYIGHIFWPGWSNFIKIFTYVGFCIYRMKSPERSDISEVYSILSLTTISPNSIRFYRLCRLCGAEKCALAATWFTAYALNVLFLFSFYSNQTFIRGNTLFWRGKYMRVLWTLNTRYALLMVLYTATVTPHAPHRAVWAPML